MKKRRASQSGAEDAAVVLNWSGRAGWLLVGCLCFEILLVVLDVVINMANWTGHPPLARMFNIAREDGLASWFGITQTLLAGLTGLLIWRVVCRQQAQTWRRWGWALVAFLLLYMAVDDGVQVHERLGSMFHSRQEQMVETTTEEYAVTVEGRTISWFPSYGWQVLFGPVLALAGGAMLVFLWIELGAGKERWLVVTALACFAFAVGLDFFEGLADDHPWNAYVWIIDRYDLIDFTARHFDSLPFATVKHWSKSLEEFLEMAGMTLLWAALIHQLGRVAPRLTFQSQPAS